MCFNQKVCEWIRSCDQLGVPISLNLNQQSIYKTKLGGCCSLIAIVVLLIVFYINMIEVVQQNTETSSYYSFVKEEDREAFTFASDEVIPAIQMLNMSRTEKTFNILDYLRPYI